MPRLSAKRLVPLILTMGLVAAWPFRLRETAQTPVQNSDDCNIRLKLPFALPLQVAPMIESSPAWELDETNTGTKSKQVLVQPELHVVGHLDRDQPPPSFAPNYESIVETENEFGSSTGQPRKRENGIFTEDDGNENNLHRYRIRDGDTLKTIAKKFLGGEARFAEIFELNEQRLPYDNPDLLPVGTEILIPPGPGDGS